MNKSPWLDFDQPTFPTLSETLETDVVIVGGGIAGVSTLYYLLKNTSKKVVLLERDHIASGATGHNAGFVVNYMEMVTQDVVQKFGLEQAKVGYKELDSAWDLLYELLDTIKARDHFTLLGGGVLGYTSTKWLLKAAEEEIADEQVGRGAWRYLVSDAVMTESEIPDHLKSYISSVPAKQILEALRIQDEGYIAAAIPYNPKIIKARSNSAYLCFKMLAYLKENYTDRFQVFEKSGVLKIDLGKRPVQVICEQGTVSGEDVILCTNGYTNFEIIDHKNPITKLKDSISGLIGYMVAYYDLSSEVWTSALFDDRGIYKTVPYFYYHRGPSFESEKYLTVLGGPEGEVHAGETYNPDEEIRSEFIEIDKQFLKKSFGEVRESFDYQWHGLMGYTKNGVRWLGKDPDYPHLLYNLGCNGIGLLPSIGGGEKISRIINGEKFLASFTDPV